MRMRMSIMDVGMRLGDAIDPFQLANGFEAVVVSVVYCKRKRNILWNVRVFRGIIEALKQQPRPI